MQPDWNWFFSALAQSTAAIVGLIGAFVFTKLVNNQQDFQADTRTLRRLLTEACDLKTRCRLADVSTYNEVRRSKELGELRNRLAKSGTENGDATPEHWYRRLSFSPYDSKADVIKSIKSILSEQEPPNALSAGSSSDHALEQTELTSRKETIDNLYATSSTLSETITVFLQRANQNRHYSRVIEKICILLVLMYFLGVAYPLGLLPITPEHGGHLTLTITSVPNTLLSLTGGLLIVISLMFCSVVVYFLITNRSLTFTDADLAALERFATIDEYSEFFRHRIANERT